MTKVSRLGLVFVALAFCLPLYIGLGRADLRGDEAGHSFSVQRILEIGDWLAPRSSPGEDAVFLEKPPLKFWIVAAPIHFGLLPNDEFGLRFWDALFAGVAFLYVFAIGTELAGSISGAVAVMILFVHYPLLFEHGVRGNNMEAALLLCYCGGIYHFMRWVRLKPDPTTDWAAGSEAVRSRNDGASGSEAVRSEQDVAWRFSRTSHVTAVALYFVLGFMTKFVAAIFLPFVLFVTTLLFGDLRRKLVRDWRAWMMAAALAIALIAPWFVYAQVRFGNELWDTMFGAHVYTRFTTYLNPAHVQPWSFYFVTMYDELVASQASILVVPGLALLVFMTIRRRWPQGAVVLLWGALPLALISIGTSKLYHYAYPFLPPAALAGGYIAGVAFMLGPSLLARGMFALDDYTRRSAAGLRRTFDRPAVRSLTLAVAVVAAAIAIVNVFYGPVRLVVGGTQIFKSSGAVRPGLVLVAAAVLTGMIRPIAQLVVLLLIAGELPIPIYHDVFARLNTGEHPMRAARDCVLRVQSQADATASPRGLYVDGLGDGFGHEHYYYFRTIRPWELAPTPSPGKLYRYINDPAERRPMLVLDSVYRDFLHGVDRPADADAPSGPVPLVSFTDVDLLLPGPYAVCSSEVPNREALR